MLLSVADYTRTSDRSWKIVCLDINFVTDNFPLSVQCGGATMSSRGNLEDEDHLLGARSNGGCDEALVENVNIHQPQVAPVYSYLIEVVAFAPHTNFSYIMHDGQANHLLMFSHAII